MIKLSVHPKDKQANATVKSLGAWWNREGKFWYVPAGRDYQPFVQWIDEQILKDLSVVELPFSSVFKHISNSISVPLLRYKVEGDVVNEHDLSKGKMIYLIDNQQPQNQLPVLLPWENIPPLIDTRISLTGQLDLYQNGKFQFVAEEIHFYDQLCSRLQYIENWKNECKDLLVLTDSLKDDIKLDFSSGINVGVITAKDSEGYTDFIKTLKKQSVLGNKGELISLEIVLSAENIQEAIVQLQSQCDCICIIRGGGDKELLLPFSHPTLLKAIFDSKVPIITGVGHSSDILLCKRVKGSYNADTPTGAAQYLNRLAGRYYNQIRSNNQIDEQKLLKHSLERANADIEQLEQDRIELQYVLNNAYQEIKDLKHNIDKLSMKLAEVSKGASSKKSFWQWLFK